MRRMKRKRRKKGLENQTTNDSSLLDSVFHPPSFFLEPFHFSMVFLKFEPWCMLFFLSLLTKNEKNHLSLPYLQHLNSPTSSPLSLL